eukprot:2409980-Heterocapsa_arctica.AAC.1
MVLCTSNLGIEQQCCSVLLKLNCCLKLMCCVQNDKRSARNLMVLARMPEDPYTTLNNIQTL